MMTTKVSKIAIVTSGGDAPGMNAAVRAVTLRARAEGICVMGVRKGYRGLLYNEMMELDETNVANYIALSGTELWSDRCKEFATPEGVAKAAKERGMNVWCYTGFTLEALMKEQNPDRMRLLGFVDVLVDGPYLSHERSLDLLYRGSKNQRLIDMKKTREAGEICPYELPVW